MKIKKIFAFIFAIIFLLGTGIQAKKIATLNELVKPDMIALGNNRIYITDCSSIYIYSLKDFRLIKKFGKEGEGPQEFKANPMGFPITVVPHKDKLFVSSSAKVSFYTKDGEFINEQKVIPLQLFWPIKNNFIATGSVSYDKGQMVLSVNLHNEKYERIKTLYVSDIQLGSSFIWDFPLTAFVFRSYKDNVYLVKGKEGFVIDVFDDRGAKLYRIKKNFKPLNVTREYKNKTLEWFKVNPNYKRLWEFFKTRITFKDHFPPIQDMFVKDDRIYVITYKTHKGETECIIMDLKGNEQKRVFVPYQEMPGMEYAPRSDIYNRAFYALVENEDEESWELHKSDAIK